MKTEISASTLSEVQKEEERERLKPIREAEERRKREEAETKEAAEKEERREKEAKTQEEKIAWIEKNGSERLKKGVTLGYNCNKIYYTERGRSIIDTEGYIYDYIYDYDNIIYTKDRSCPSTKAIQEIERLQEIAGVAATIVWLPDGLEELEEEEDRHYYNEYPHCEAIKVDIEGTPGYWYKAL